MQGFDYAAACAALALVISVAQAAEPGDRASGSVAPSTARSNVAPRYTFSWPLNGHAVSPRGGTSRGAPVEIDTAPSPAWQSLQAPGISALERDRRAILAMAGEYRVTFDFLEIASYGESAMPNAPYQSWGTEKIYVDADEGGYISLVHVLEMRFVQEDGAISPPMVTKHWRQDWFYEPTHIVEYQGHSRWRRRKLSAPARGAWLQAVIKWTSRRGTQVSELGSTTSAFPHG